MFSSAQSSTFNTKIPHALESATSNRLSLPYSERASKGKKILMVFDSSNGSERKDGKLLGTHVGELMDSCFKYIAKLYPKIPKIQSYQWATINLDYLFDDDNEEACRQYNERRLLKYIERVQPDYVWCFGDSFEMFHKMASPTIQAATHGNLLGIPFPITYKDHEFEAVPILSPHRMFRFGSGDRDPDAYMIGYMMQNMANALNGGRVWDVDLKVENIKSTYVNTIGKFRKMMKYLRKYRVLAVDTETDGLAKVQVKLLTIQFAVKKTQGFFLPIYHYDTPFNSEELEEITETLAEFFVNHDFERVVFHNTNYDLNVIRSNLKIRHLPFDTWDTQDGEFANDENMKVLQRWGVFPGKGAYFSLANLAIQFGFMGYITGDFGKEKRVTITNIPLNTPGLIEYGVYDVCVPFAIHEMQLARAKAKKYLQYPTLVQKQLSDTQHMFSVMNNIGALIDQSYLWWLDSPDSKVKKEIQRLEDEILALPEIAKAEALIRKEQGIPTVGLFGNVAKTAKRLFSLRRKRHVQILFFDVFGLEEVTIGKDGTPNLDGHFQEAHGDNEAVKLYGAIKKVQTLQNNYIKGTLKLLSNDRDAQSDGRIRSTYGIRGVVTHRISSSKPNLQNLPSRSELGKEIKRYYVAPKGKVLVALDFSAAEVRGLAIIGNDLKLAAAFQVGLDLRNEYLKHPTPERKLQMKTVGDVHMLNASRMFGFDLGVCKEADDVKQFKDFRNAVKAVIFGSIYGRSIASIAAQIGRTEEETEKLLDEFYAEFHGSGEWLERIEQEGKKNLFVEGPVGSRRHLWPYMIPNSWKGSFNLKNACNRRARNAPIQGFASQINFVGMRLFEERVYADTKHLETPPIEIFNTVHDAVYLYVDYSHVLYAISTVRECMMGGMQQRVLNRHKGYAEFPISMEVDLEFGGSWGKLHGFDGHLQQLHDSLRKTIEFQKTELKHDIDVLKTMDVIFGRKGEKIPDEYREQIANGYFDPIVARKELRRSLAV